MKPITTFACLVALLPLACAGPAVVINEILYNAPDDLDDVQWIELFNAGDDAADLGNWTLDQGKLFTFPAGTRIAPHGFVVVALSPEKFKQHYGLDSLGPLKRPLKRGSERLFLRDARAEVADVARYKDEAPWPVSADGYSASVERICPTAPGDVPQNWAGSPLPAKPKPAGTPGQTNACFSAALPPEITVAEVPPIVVPGEALALRATVRGEVPVTEVALQFLRVTDGTNGPITSQPMTKAGDGQFVGSIPAQRSGTLVRFWVTATDQRGAKRRFPAEHELRPTLSAFVHEPWATNALASVELFLGGEDREVAASQPGMGGFPGRPGGFEPPRGESRPPGGSGPPAGFGPPREAGTTARDGEAPPEGAGPTPANLPPVSLGSSAGEPTRAGGGPPPGFVGPRRENAEPPRGGRPGGDRPGQGPRFMFGPPGFGGEIGRTPRAPRGASTLIYVDGKTGAAELFDYLNAVPRGRKAGFKLHFQKDRPFHGMSALSLFFEGSERMLLAEALSYDVYRRAGNAAPWTEFVRVTVDGRYDGAQLLVERPNKSYLRRNQISDTGNLYKLRWYGQGLIGQHDKRTNTQTGHEDLLALVDLLEKSQGNADELWRVAQQHFFVDQVATHFAVNMVVSHWDGFFNNYYTYHDPKQDKWLMIPWDHDQTWGIGAFGEQPLTDIPLTFGMEGAVPPGGTARSGDRDRFGFGGPFGGGGPVWWRPGGYFSRPLLANPQFRKLFLARIRDILDRVYTEQNYFPMIDAMVAALQTAPSPAGDSGRRNGPGGWGPPGGGGGRGHLAEDAAFLKTHLRQRRDFLLSQPELKR